ncbi:MAG TPA: hypothetical protein QGF58_07515 [Myxococcota bacterium]|nr:hypothetical protein [Myxococcota bacterium]
MRPLVAVTCTCLGLGGGLLAHLAQVRADDGRRERTAQYEMLVMPSPETVHFASQGLHAHVATLMWVRSVLEFGERIDMRNDGSWQEWFARMIECVVELDPAWRTPYFYGGVMLRVTGSASLSTEIFARGAEAHPEDAYFPFSVGMNYYLLEEDYEQAAVWLDRAAAIPSAPDWYRMTAVSMREKGSGRDGAVRYLEMELEQATDPWLRSRIEARIVTVTHDHYAELMTEQIAVLDQRGLQVTDLQQLIDEGLVDHLPPEPAGGEWVFDPEYRDALSDERFALRLRGEYRSERKMFQWVPDYQR